MYSSQVQNRREHQLAQTVDRVLANAAHCAVDICHCKNGWRTRVQLLVRQHSRSFSARVTPSQPDLSLYCCLKLFQPTCRTLPLSLFPGTISKPWSQGISEIHRFWDCSSDPSLMAVGRVLLKQMEMTTIYTVKDLDLAFFIILFFSEYPPSWYKPLIFISILTVFLGSVLTCGNDLVLSLFSSKWEPWFILLHSLTWSLFPSACCKYTDKCVNWNDCQMYWKWVISGVLPWKYLHSEV